MIFNDLIQNNISGLVHYLLSFVSSLLYGTIL